MALFQINRFVGDDEDQVSAGQATDILKKLKEHARKKKQEKTNRSNKEKKTSFCAVTESPLKRKTVCENEGNDLSKPKKLKKKKRESKSEEIDEDIEDTSVLFHNKLDINVTNAIPDSLEIKKKLKKDKTKSEKIDKKHKKIKEIKIGKTETEKIDKPSDGEISDSSSSKNVESKKISENELKRREDKSSKFIKDGPHVVGNFTVLGDYKIKPEVKVKHVLPVWLANPGVISSDLTETLIDKLGLLDSNLIDKLQENNITHFFPVQTQILPLLLNQMTHNNCYGQDGYQPSDICVSAPTGSGKTLAFALPIIQTLLNRVVCRVRALIVLPVRDLALQVYKVFQTYCEGTELRVALLAGQNTLSEEQESLVVKRLTGCCSLVDIVVATPGRLVDHINKTTGFSLSHLRFLVIDEADRMMNDIKQDWLAHVEKSVFKIHGESSWSQLDRTRPRPITISSCSRIKLAFQKLLFSATLSQDPEKLQQLNLFQPQLYTTLVKPSPTNLGNSDGKTDSEDNQGDFVGKYSTPATLKERHIECKANLKPLSVLHCVHNLNYRQILCFTNSVESTHRLYLLVKLCGGIKVREFSSALSGNARQKILTDFSSGNIDMIICSDAMARGMDIESVQYVILYDRPTHIETYIHRVGRTARAGKPGTAITILEQREVCSYKTMLKEAGKLKFKKLKIKHGKLFSLKPMYDEALERLPVVIKAEKKERREAH